MKTNNNMKIVLMVITLFTLSGCDESERQIERQVKRNIAWCVDICSEDILKDLHNKGESWGTGSSSLTGMTQNNTLTSTREYCETVYKHGCFEVTYSNPLAIHGDYIMASNGGYK